MDRLVEIEQALFRGKMNTFNKRRFFNSEYLIKKPENTNYAGLRRGFSGKPHLYEKKIVIVKPYI